MSRRCNLFWLLLLVAGCGKSTADWAKQAKSADPAKRLHAIHALQQRTAEKEVVIPVLVDALNDSDTYVRRDSARALGQFGSAAQQAVPALVARLKTDPEPSVRKAAARALKQIAPPAAGAGGR